MVISIHAPHTRSDPQYQLYLQQHGISIHAPHTRSDPCLGVTCV
ncbi:MAG: hypothetical protein ACFWT1_03360 [Selenomonas sp.]